MPFRTLGDPLADFSGRMKYVDAQKIYDADYPNGLRYYWKSTNLTSIPDEVVDVLVDRTLAAPSQHSTIDIWLNGGAIARVGEVGHRVPGTGQSLCHQPRSQLGARRG